MPSASGRAIGEAPLKASATRLPCVAQAIRTSVASLGAPTGTNRKEVSALLALTDSAVQAVKEIVSSSEEAHETGGLRLVAARAGAQASFQLSVVALPAEDDEVIEEQGARLFLDPEAASLLEDKVLDASVEQNQVEFTLEDHVEE
jgi:iron-sulfur cluster assembly protein